MYDVWYPWFAWYPTKIERGMWVWLRYIERQNRPGGYVQRSIAPRWATNK